MGARGQDSTREFSKADVKDGHYLLEVDIKTHKARPTYCWVQALGGPLTAPLPLDADAPTQPRRVRVVLAEQEHYQVQPLQL